MHYQQIWDLHGEFDALNGHQLLNEMAKRISDLLPDPSQGAPTSRFLAKHKEYIEQHNKLREQSKFLKKNSKEYVANVLRDTDAQKFELDNKIRRLQELLKVHEGLLRNENQAAAQQEDEVQIQEQDDVLNADEQEMFLQVMKETPRDPNSYI